MLLVKMIMIEAAPPTINMPPGPEQGAREIVTNHYRMRTCKHANMRMIKCARNGDSKHTAWKNKQKKTTEIDKTNQGGKSRNL